MIQPLAQGSRQHYTVPILVLDISLKLFFNFLFIDSNVYIPFSNFDIYLYIIYLFIYSCIYLLKQQFQFVAVDSTGTERSDHCAINIYE